MPNYIIEMGGDPCSIDLNFMFESIPGSKTSRCFLIVLRLRSQIDLPTPEDDSYIVSEETTNFGSV